MPRMHTELCTRKVNTAQCAGFVRRMPESSCSPLLLCWTLASQPTSPTGMAHYWCDVLVLHTQVLVMEWVDGERLRTAYSAARDASVASIDVPGVSEARSKQSQQTYERWHWHCLRVAWLAGTGVAPDCKFSTLPPARLPLAAPAAAATTCGWWRWGCAARWSRCWRRASTTQVRSCAALLLTAVAPTVVRREALNSKVEDLRAWGSYHSSSLYR